MATNAAAKQQALQDALAPTPGAEHRLLTYDSLSCSAGLPVVATVPVFGQSGLRHRPVQSPHLQANRQLSRAHSFGPALALPIVGV